MKNPTFQIVQDQNSLMVLIHDMGQLLALHFVDNVMQEDPTSMGGK